MKTIAILGCGNIGRIVAGQAENVRFVGVFDQDEGRCRDVASLCGATACKTFDALMALDFDLLVEAASVEAVRAFAPRVIEAGIPRKASGRLRAVWAVHNRIAAL